MNIVHKYFQETSKQLFGGFFVVVWLVVCFFYVFLRESFFSREQYCCWHFQQVCERGLLCLGLGSLFGWLLILLSLSPSIFGSLGKWVVLCCCFLVWFVFLTTCELFEQAGFCGSEIYLLIYNVCVCFFVGFAISEGTFVFIQFLLFLMSACSW